MATKKGMRLGSLLGKTKKSELDQSEQDQFAPYRLSNTGKNDSLNTKLL